MSVRKLTRQQWEYEIKRAMRVRDAQQRKVRKAKYAYFEQYVGRVLPLSILLGVAAVLLLIILYGWKEFFKFLLSWIVSLTLVATGVYYIWKSYERKL